MNCEFEVGDIIRKSNDGCDRHIIGRILRIDNEIITQCQTCTVYVLEWTDYVLYDQLRSDTRRGDEYRGLILNPDSNDGWKVEQLSEDEALSYLI